MTFVTMAAAMIVGGDDGVEEIDFTGRIKKSSREDRIEQSSGEIEPGWALGGLEPGEIIRWIWVGWGRVGGLVRALHVAVLGADGGSENARGSVENWGTGTFM